MSAEMLIRITHPIRIGLVHTSVYHLRHTENKILVLPAGLEPATYGLEDRRSNPLSYGSIFW